MYTVHNRLLHELLLFPYLHHMTAWSFFGVPVSCYLGRLDSMIISLEAAEIEPTYLDRGPLSSNWVRAKPAPPAAADAPRPATAAEVRKAAPDQRLHRAISENVIGQTLPFDAGILQSDRNRHTRASFVRRPSSA